MEYRITLSEELQEYPTLLEAALLEADPAAIFDVDPSHVIRVATSLAADDVTSLLHAQGGPFADARMELLPSICCGGCSG